MATFDFSNLTTFFMGVEGSCEDIFTYAAPLPNSERKCEWFDESQMPDPADNHSHYSVMLDDMEPPICGEPATVIEHSDRYDHDTAYCTKHALVNLGECQSAGSTFKGEVKIR